MFVDTVLLISGFSISALTSGIEGIVISGNNGSVTVTGAGSVIASLASSGLTNDSRISLWTFALINSALCAVVVALVVASGNSGNVNVGSCSALWPIPLAGCAF